MDEQTASVVEETVAVVAPEVAPAEQAPEGAPAQPASPIEQAKQAVANTAQAVQETPFAKTVHKVLLAGVGAMALTKDELEDFMHKLVERGQLAETDAKKVAHDVLAERKKQMDEQVEEQRKRLNAKIGMGKRRAKKIEGVVDQRIEAVLARADIPTKEDIETLSAKITALSEKVDALKKPK